MLVNVVNLVARGALAEIWCAAEKVHTRFFWKGEHSGHRGQKQTAEVVEVDPHCKV